MKNYLTLAFMFMLSWSASSFAQDAEGNINVGLSVDIEDKSLVATAEDDACQALNLALEAALQTDASNVLSGVNQVFPLVKNPEMLALLSPENQAIANETIRKTETRIAKFGGGTFEKDGKTWPSYAAYKLEKASAGADSCVAQNQAARDEYMRLVGTEQKPGSLRELVSDLNAVTEMIEAAMPQASVN